VAPRLPFPSLPLFFLEDQHAHIKPRHSRLSLRLLGPAGLGLIFPGLQTGAVNTMPLVRRGNPREDPPQLLQRISVCTMPNERSTDREKAPGMDKDLKYTGRPHPGPDPREARQSRALQI
jgi:hypothetical protein